MKRKIMVGFGMGVIVLLSGCGDDPYTGSMDGYDSPPTSMSADNIDELALDMAWDGMTAQDRINICEGVEVFGLERASAMVADGGDGGLDIDAIRAKLAEECV